jgi:sulfur-carrier protein
MKTSITITVRSFAMLREFMDAELRMEFPKGTTVRQLLGELTGRYTGISGLLFDDPDTLRDMVNILRNGRNIAFLAGLDTPIEDGDTIALFPPVGGG